ncbi:MAG TPA: DUF3391 domain-containing protein [Macromonas sp.]|nr:DUF3391 domain-containing protein [Macromonas sp.]
MQKNTGPFIDITELRPGHFVHLDLGWMDHPFPLGNFKITSQQQIDTIRALGLKQIRWSPEKSELPAPEITPNEPAPDQAVVAAFAAPLVDPTVLEEQQRRRALLVAQRQSLVQCERQFTENARSYQLIMSVVESQPEQAFQEASALIQGMLQAMNSHEECAIRLLSENVGDRFALHSVNVTVLSMLLGKAAGLSPHELEALGMGALLHDIGKQRLPDRVRFKHENFTLPETKLYQEHVAHSVTMGKRMGLVPETLLAISQHHEMTDGSGFPLACQGEKMSRTAHVLALINRYDNLCNPPNPVLALTPHEALSLIFARMRGRFDKTTLNAFIRMMGIYPPGSLVQLSDQRYGLVMSVNSARPLKPRVLIHDDATPLSEAVYLDMEQTPHLNVLRSLKPQQLPRSALEYLAPRQRVCYYFERATDAATPGNTQ